MKRSIIIGLSAAALMLTACSGAGSVGASQPNAGSENNSAVASLTDEDGAGRSTIKVSSSEQVNVDPDMASVSLGVSSIEDTVEQVTKINSEAVDTVIQYFKDAGYEDRSISTTDVSLYPTYDYKNGDEKITGYRMYTDIEVKDIKKDDVGAVLAGAIGTGANSIDSIRYYSSSYDEAYSEALDLAVKAAGEKAAVIAQSSGGQLGVCVSIEEYTPDTYGRYSRIYGSVDKAALTEDSAGPGMNSLKLMPSQIEVTANISVTYELVK